jgi:formylmethanofuran dehydrogenase subunit E
MKQTQRKQQLEKQVRIYLNRSTKNNWANNAYQSEIKLREKAKLKKKLTHRKAQQKYRANHKAEIRTYNRNYYLSHKQNCFHVAKIEINPNYDAVKLICSKCGVLLAKC